MSFVSSLLVFLPVYLFYFGIRALLSAPLSSSRAVSDSAIRVCVVFLQHFVTLSPTCVNLAAFSKFAIRALELVLSTRAQ